MPQARAGRGPRRAGRSRPRASSSASRAARPASRARWRPRCRRAGRSCSSVSSGAVAGEHGRPVRHAQAPAQLVHPLRRPARCRRGGLLRRRHVARRHARLGVGRRPGRRARLRGRLEAARGRDDPGAELPGGHRLRQRRRTATGSTWPTTSPAARATSTRRATRVTVIDPATSAVTNVIDLGVAAQPLGVTFDRTRHEGVRDAVAGPLGLGRRHGDRDDAAPGRRSRPRRTRSRPTIRRRSRPTPGATRSTPRTPTPTPSR